MEWLVASESDVVVSGTAENQGLFHDRIEYLVLLSAPLDILLERVSRRANNPYGKGVAQGAEVAHFQRTVEPSCVRDPQWSWTVGAPSPSWPMPTSRIRMRGVP